MIVLGLGVQARIETLFLECKLFRAWLDGCVVEVRDDQAAHRFVLALVALGGEAAAFAVSYGASRDERLVWLLGIHVAFNRLLLLCNRRNLGLEGLRELELHIVMSVRALLTKRHCRALARFVPARSAIVRTISEQWAHDRLIELFCVVGTLGADHCLIINHGVLLDLELLVFELSLLLFQLL